MLNQSFTADNFRKIFDYENRKGNYLEGLFFPEIEKITQEIKECASKIHSLNKKKSDMSRENYEDERQTLKDKNDLLKKEKEALLLRELEKIGEKITSRKYRFTVAKVTTNCGAEVFNVEKDVCGFFAIKQLQSNLRKLYKIQQSNRYNVINQLSCILNGDFPKWVFRTDIKSFYENISSEEVLKKINSEHLLTSLSKRFIRQILMDYKVSTGCGGLPRGIGISAYLSELYMRDFDTKTKSHSEIIFYARYVDDIVIVLSPKPNSNPRLIIDEIKQEISKLGLSLNPKKTKELDLNQPKIVILEYLGYTFSFGGEKVTLSLSANRLNKYKERIKLTFNDYHLKSKYNEKEARKLLIKRLHD